MIIAIWDALSVSRLLQPILWPRGCVKVDSCRHDLVQDERPASAGARRNASVT